MQIFNMDDNDFIWMGTVKFSGITVTSGDFPLNPPPFCLLIEMATLSEQALNPHISF